jgi:hypothetical protein
VSIETVDGRPALLVAGGLIEEVDQVEDDAAAAMKMMANSTMPMTHMATATHPMILPA